MALWLSSGTERWLLSGVHGCCSRELCWAPESWSPGFWVNRFIFQNSYLTHNKKPALHPINIWFFSCEENHKGYLPLSQAFWGRKMCLGKIMHLKFRRGWASLFTSTSFIVKCLHYSILELEEIFLLGYKYFYRRLQRLEFALFIEVCSTALMRMSRL